MKWRQYQEDSAELFRSLGLEAQTDVRLRGVRTHHDIDVLVVSRHAGFDITWLVECKQWSAPVSKVHVLALREIVADTGADRGLLLTESGAQSGAHEAAALTNVRITSLAQIRGEARHEINMVRLTELYDRLAPCKTHYWEIPKEVRIAHGLRPDIFADGYSGQLAIKALEDILAKAIRGRYPFEVAFENFAVVGGVPERINSSQEAIEVAQPMIEELERKLSHAALKQWNPRSSPDA